MAAKKGNKYAEKWTKQVVLDHLQQIFEDVEENKLVYLAVALTNLGLYSDIWADWKTKFDSVDEVSRLIKRIESKIEANLVTRLLNNQCNAAGAIFILKNKHRMSDKQEIDHTSAGQPFTINITKTYKSDSEGDSN
ncbi:terminase small subunit [Pedobacter nyackensis]|uniref:terminase small subunit n=1 Tax=Pedobacter nyackensis TaxID=475255 RepID=UPI00292F13AA|nr:terminase small subunit [Pedobacter nyackensis]